jgi:hypothetical protein
MVCIDSRIFRTPRHWTGSEGFELASELAELGESL